MTKRQRKELPFTAAPPKSGFYNSNCKVVVDDANIQKIWKVQSIYIKMK
jgi:hypothetical protein